jgi:hypothetical protein
VLQVGRSRVRYLFRLLDCLIYPVQPHYCAGVDSASNRNEFHQAFVESKARPAHKADNRL